jgi:hypothetical protein
MGTEGRVSFLRDVAAFAGLRRGPDWREVRRAAQALGGFDHCYWGRHSQHAAAPVAAASAATAAARTDPSGASAACGGKSAEQLRPPVAAPAHDAASLLDAGPAGDSAVDADPGKVDPGKVARLVDMGYLADMASDALRASGNDLEAAVEALVAFTSDDTGPNPGGVVYRLTSWSVLGRNQVR